MNVFNRESRIRSHPNMRAYFIPDIIMGCPLRFNLERIDDEMVFVNRDRDGDIIYNMGVIFADDNWIIEIGQEEFDVNGKEIFEGDNVLLRTANSPKDTCLHIGRFSRLLFHDGIINKCHISGHWTDKYKDTEETLQLKNEVLDRILNFIKRISTDNLKYVDEDSVWLCSHEDEKIIIDYKYCTDSQAVIINDVVYTDKNLGSFTFEMFRYEQQTDINFAAINIIKYYNGFSEK